MRSSTWSTTVVERPDHLFIIGAQRSGTTSLFLQLDAHPSVTMAKPVKPEPKFFLDNDALEPGWQDRYQQFFPHPEGKAVLGEKSTTYIERSDAGERIAIAFPEAKIVALVRDPIERAVSNYRFSVANGYERRPIDAALDPQNLVPESPADVSTSPYALSLIHI